MLQPICIALLLLGLNTSCTDDNSNTDNNLENKVALLKVDYLTNTFEGGTELNFDPSISFTIYSVYNPPGDFGDIQLYYQELDELLFDGTIIWMGLGERSYPSSLMDPNDFSTIDSALQIPDTADFEKVMYAQYAFYPDSINYTGIWTAIDQLEIVSNYRSSNPNEAIHLFLYTPSVGIGDPADWDWYVIISN